MDQCWTALRYTKPQQFKTTLTLNNADDHIAVSMKAKKALVCKSAFPSPPVSSHNKPIVHSEVAHKTVTNDIVDKSLMTQSSVKVPGQDKINFWILRMI